jgi:hypothetical protein
MHTCIVTTGLKAVLVQYLEQYVDILFFAIGPMCVETVFCHISCILKVESLQGCYAASTGQ